jgi:hypothetical protein
MTLQVEFHVFPFRARSALWLDFSLVSEVRALDSKVARVDPKVGQ